MTHARNAMRAGDAGHVPTDPAGPGPWPRIAADVNGVPDLAIARTAAGRAASQARSLLLG